MNGCASFSTMYTNSYFGENCQSFLGSKIHRFSVADKNRLRLIVKVDKYLTSLGMSESNIPNRSPLRKTWATGAWDNNWTPPATNVEGQGARVMATINADCLLVTIHDFDNSRKTQFMSEIESGISMIITEEFGGIDINFERQSNFLGP